MPYITKDTAANRGYRSMVDLEAKVETLRKQVV